MKRFLLTSAVLLTMLCGTSCLERIKKPFRGWGKKATPEVEVTKKVRLQEQRLQLLEKDAVIARLEQRLVSHRQMLDDAIQEVVRAKAKHSTPQDRGRAASESAEAEIALESLRREPSRRQTRRASGPPRPRAGSGSCPGR